MKSIIIIAFCLVCFNANAQFGKDILNRAKESAKQKVNNKIDQKTDEGLDKAVNAPEKAIDKKIKKKNKKAEDIDAIENTNNAATTTTPTTDIPVVTEETPVGEGAQTVIQTNIFCNTGKKKIESFLKKQSGIFEVKTNITNGEVSIRYNSDGTSYSSLLKYINEQGYEADGNKPEKAAKPCKS